MSSKTALKLPFLVLTTNFPVINSLYTLGNLVGVFAFSLNKMMCILNNLCYHTLKTPVIVLVQFTGVLANPQLYHMLSNFSS